MKKSKTLADMKHEEIDLGESEPLWEIKYKNFTFIAYKNSFYGDRDILSCYIFRDDELLEHSGRTIYFTEEKALEEIKQKYKWYLKNEVIEIIQQKASKTIIPPSDFNEPFIKFELGYENVSEEEWEKVKEYFDL